MAEADVAAPPAAAENPPEEERKAPGYRFPVVEEATGEFAVHLPLPVSGRAGRFFRLPDRNTAFSCATSAAATRSPPSPN